MRSLSYFRSSNLSPLAPPFTVDRSAQNNPTLTTNPIPHSHDPSSSTPKHEFPIDSSTPISKNHEYSYSYTIPDSIISSTVTHNWFALNPTVNPSPVSFNSPKNDEIIPSSELFSTSGPVRSHEIDYTRELSGLKYDPNPNPQNGEEDNIAASFDYSSYSNQGTVGFPSGFGYGDNDNSRLYYANMIRRANENEKSNGGSLFADDPLCKSKLSVRKSSPIVIKPPSASISVKDDTKKLSVSDEVKFEFKASSSVPRVPDINVNIPDTSASYFDHHNSAEDSPCWKGTHHPTKEGDDRSLNEKTSSNREEAAAVLPDEIHEGTGDTEVNASVIVKELYDLSDLLSRACSNDVLKKRDLEVLDRATRNLGVYVSRQAQLAPASTNKPVKNDGDDPGENMVQVIKKALEENLETDVEYPSEMYKSLWLEAEAELCCLSYKARLNRLKRERRFQGEAAAGRGSVGEHILKDEVS